MIVPSKPSPWVEFGADISEEEDDVVVETEAGAG